METMRRPIITGQFHCYQYCQRFVRKLLLNQFLPYLVSNDHLTTKQNGNKRFHSTETSLIHTTDFILNAMDKKKTTAIVLLDMSKAVDSINHGILLNKQKI